MGFPGGAGKIPHAMWNSQKIKKNKRQCHIMLFTKTQMYNHIIFPFKIYYRFNLPQSSMNKDNWHLLFGSPLSLSPSQVLCGPIMSNWSVSQIWHLIRFHVLFPWLAEPLSPFSMWKIPTLSFSLVTSSKKPSLIPSFFRQSWLLHTVEYHTISNTLDDSSKLAH